jgi:hypothetical protein
MPASSVVGSAGHAGFGASNAALPPPPNFTSFFKLVREAVDIENGGDYDRASSIYERAGSMASQLAETADEKTRDMVQNKAKVLKKRGHALKQHLQTHMFTLGGEAKKDDLVSIEKDTSFKEGYEKGVHPSILRDKRFQGQGDETQEFRNLRYLPILESNPLDVTSAGYSLRASKQKRKIKFLINITMYNEDAHEMNDTLQAICDNLEYMQKARAVRSRTPVWKQAAVNIVSDGRTKMNSGTKSWMSKNGLFDNAMMTLYEQGGPANAQLVIQCSASTSPLLPSLLSPASL